MQLRFRDIESNISPLRFFSELLGIHSYCNVNYEISIVHYRPPLAECHTLGRNAPWEATLAQWVQAQRAGNRFAS